MSTKQFDPIAYIENGFVDAKKKEVMTVEAAVALDVEVPSIRDYLGPRDDAHLENGSGDPRLKFKKRKLSAPRPRRAKVSSHKDNTAVVDDNLKETWTLLPKNIQFLGSFFDDKVTSHYYRGNFKETREELIRRLLDPELTLEEVSRLLGVCPATVRRYTNRGWLGHHRTKGGQRRFRLSGVVKFVDEHGRHPEE